MNGVRGHILGWGSVWRAAARPGVGAWLGGWVRRGVCLGGWRAPRRGRRLGGWRGRRPSLEGRLGRRPSRGRGLEGLRGRGRRLRRGGRLGASGGTLPLIRVCGIGGRREPGHRPRRVTLFENPHAGPGRRRWVVLGGCRGRARCSVAGGWRGPALTGFRRRWAGRGGCFGPARLGAAGGWRRRRRGQRGPPRGRVHAFTGPRRLGACGMCWWQPHHWEHRRPPRDMPRRDWCRVPALAHIVPLVGPLVVSEGRWPLAVRDEGRVPLGDRLTRQVSRLAAPAVLLSWPLGLLRFLESCFAGLARFPACWSALEGLVAFPEGDAVTNFDRIRLDAIPRHSCSFFQLLRRAADRQAPHSPPHFCPGLARVLARHPVQPNIIFVSALTSVPSIGSGPKMSISSSSGQGRGPRVGVFLGPDGYRRCWWP